MYNTKVWKLIVTCKCGANVGQIECLTKEMVAEFVDYLKTRSKGEGVVDKLKEEALHSFKHISLKESS